MALRLAGRLDPAASGLLFIGAAPSLRGTLPPDPAACLPVGLRYSRAIRFGNNCEMAAGRRLAILVNDLAAEPGRDKATPTDLQVGPRGRIPFAYAGLAEGIVGHPHRRAILPGSENGIEVILLAKREPVVGMIPSF